MLTPQLKNPMAVLGLHCLSSVTLITVTAMITPVIAYFILLSLYLYVIVIVIGFFTVSGLLYLKWAKKDWVRDFKPWGGSTSAIVYRYV